MCISFFEILESVIELIVLAVPKHRRVKVYKIHE